jgi:hypothetical protein
MQLDPNGQVLNTEKGGSVKSNPPVFGGAPLFCKGINLKIQENSQKFRQLAGTALVVTAHKLI